MKRRFPTISSFLVSSASHLRVPPSRLSSSRYQPIQEFRGRLWARREEQEDGLRPSFQAQVERGAFNLGHPSMVNRRFLTRIVTESVSAHTYLENVLP